MCSLRRKGSYWASLGVRVSALLRASERTSSSGLLCIHCICSFGLSMNERHTSKTLAFHSHYTDVVRTNMGCRESLQYPFYCHPANLHNWHSTDGKGKTNSWDIVSPITFPPRHKGLFTAPKCFFSGLSDASPSQFASFGSASTSWCSLPAFCNEDTFVCLLELNWPTQLKYPLKFIFQVLLWLK